MKILSRAEELVLLAVWRLQENAYGVTIRQHIMEMTETDWSVGSVYDALEKLTEWGYLHAYQSDPTPERGGRSKRYFRLTQDGMNGLAQTKRVHEKMWSGLPDAGIDFAG